MKDSDEALCLDYFSGGVPTGGYFRFKLEDLRTLSQSASDEHGGVASVHELCYIGLFAYFEAFCKDHFASLINIEPALVANLKQRGQNVDVDGARVGSILNRSLCELVSCSPRNMTLALHRKSTHCSVLS